MATTPRQPGRPFTSLIVALTVCLFPGSSVAQGDEPQPLSLTELANVQGATALVGLGFQGHPGLQQATLLVQGHSEGLFTDLGSRLAGRERLQAAVVALHLTGATGPTAPLTAIGLFRHGEELGCWELYDPGVVQPLRPNLLKAVRDERAMPSTPTPTQDDELESEAYSDALIKVKRTPAPVFEEAVRRHSGSSEPVVTYAHVFREPWRYRGEVVRIKGKIRRVKLDENPPLTARLAGIDKTYECWLFNDEYGPNNPVCLVTTELPPGLKVREKIDQDYEVAFVGYFFKKYRYEAGSLDRPRQLRDAPMLIGHVVLARPIDPADENAEALRSAVGSIGSWSKKLLIGFLAMVGLTVVAVGWLSWWFHRGDARVRERVLARAPVLPEPEDAPADGMPLPTITLPPRGGLEPPPN